MNGSNAKGMKTRWRNRGIESVKKGDDGHYIAFLDTVQGRKDCETLYLDNGRLNFKNRRLYMIKRIFRAEGKDPTCAAHQEWLQRAEKPKARNYNDEVTKLTKPNSHQDPIDANDGWQAGHTEPKAQGDTVTHDTPTKGNQPPPNPTIIEISEPNRRKIEQQTTQRRPAKSTPTATEGELNAVQLAMRGMRKSDEICTSRRYSIAAERMRQLINASSRWRLLACS